MMMKTNFGIDVEEEVEEEDVVGVEEGDMRMMMTHISGKGDEGSNSIQR
jgi:hypothetical protein